MNENEAYEEVIKYVESINICSKFDSSFRFPIPFREDSHTSSDYDLTHRRKNSLAAEAVRAAG